jgi:CRISPR-associated protein (TIGR03984 family)
LDNSHLITSSEVNPRDQQVSPPLREETLLQARLFAPHGELLLWCEDDNQWQARLIKDVSANERPIWNEAIDEWQILWGTEAQSLDHGFTLMREGSQGLRHIVPLKVTGISKENRLRLKVRHYIQHESDDRCIGTVGGYARIVASRLVDLTGGDCSEQ